LALLGDFNENIHSFIISGVPYWCNISVPMWNLTKCIIHNLF
jgi:hypothetical protein